ncbi:MAG: SoxR reducing system RseC family protein [Gammaproteobacteria bacterium]|nr:SoxR reducing system RseC family protein [Gammaproteobacteria bacterium]
MITENAIVVSIIDDQTWIETQRKSVCGQCSASKGCGTSVLSKVIGNKLSKMKAINNVNAKVGDEVVVGLNENSLLKGAFMTYLLPLIYLFLFSFLGQFISNNLQLNNSELFIIGFAIFGFYLGMRRLKRFSASIAENKNYQPVILKKTNSSSVFVNL